jgi:hypothetical protein
MRFSFWRGEDSASPIDNFLAAHVIKRSWLRKPIVALIPVTSRCAGWLFAIRIAALIFYLAFCGSFKYGTPEGRYRQAAFASVSLLLSIIDWMPYSVYTIQRQPSNLTKWAALTTGAVSFLFHASWVYMAMVDRPDFLSRIGGAMFALVVFVCTSIRQLRMTVGWLFFAIYPAIRVPLAYEPVLKINEQNHVPIASEDPDSIDSSGGQLARLYQVQQSSDYNIEEGSDQEPERIENFISVSSHLESTDGCRVADRS